MLILLFVLEILQMIDNGNDFSHSSNCYLNTQRFYLFIAQIVEKSYLTCLPIISHIFIWLTNIGIKIKKSYII